ncbi:MAG: RodZ domain-containing protein [Pseudomonadota bacterium]
MADEILIEPATTPELSGAPLGAVFLSARNTKKLTQKDVSNNLRISIKQVCALESDDFGALPDAMITRGFIRNYARLLEIDAEPLLASYRARMPDKPPSTISVQPSTNQVLSGKDSPPWLIYILGSILILLFLLAWLFYVDYMPKPANAVVGKISEIAVANTLPVNTAPVEAALPEVALPAAERGQNNEVITGADAGNAALVVGANDSAPNIAPAQSTTAGSSQIAPAKQSGSTSPATVDVNTLKANALQPVTQAAKLETKPQDSAKSAATGKVDIAVAEQTWIRASDKSGAVVFERMLAAGSVDSFDGTPPFNVLVGNVKGTKLTFSGKLVDLTGYTKNNVARVILE